MECARLLRAGGAKHVEALAVHALFPPEREADFRSAGLARLRAELGEVRGVGPARKRALLKRFGSVRRIREASVDEVAATPGIGREVAERLKGHLARDGMLA